MLNAVHPRCRLKLGGDGNLIIRVVLAMVLLSAVATHSTSLKWSLLCLCLLKKRFKTFVQNRAKPSNQSLPPKFCEPNSLPRCYSCSQARVKTQFFSILCVCANAVRNRADCQKRQNDSRAQSVKCCCVSPVSNNRFGGDA